MYYELLENTTRDHRILNNISFQYMLYDSIRSSNALREDKLIKIDDHRMSQMLSSSYHDEYIENDHFALSHYEIQYLNWR